MLSANNGSASETISLVAAGVDARVDVSKIRPSALIIGLALLFAYVNGRTGAVDFLLEKDGNWNMTGVNNGTALHRAAWEGDLAMVGEDALDAPLEKDGAVAEGHDEAHGGP